MAKNWKDFKPLSSAYTEINETVNVRKQWAHTDSTWFLKEVNKIGMFNGGMWICAMEILNNTWSIALPCAIHKINHSVLGLDANMVLHFALYYNSRLSLMPHALFSI